MTEDFQSSNASSTLASDIHKPKCLYCNQKCARRRAKYCSRECVFNHKSPKRQCKSCGVLTSNSKYCSTICSNHDRRKIWKCIVCDNESKSYRKTKYCRKCYFENEPLEFLKWFENNYDKVIVGDKKVRRYAFLKFEHKCSICGITEWCGQEAPLTCDHINGNPLDNNPSNLRLICPNCDRFLPTFGSRNRGIGGRQYRREWRKKNRVNKSSR